MFSSADPELNRDRKEVSPAEALDGLRRTMEDLEAYFGAVTEKFRANPTDQVNSLIANAKVNGALGRTAQGSSAQAALLDERDRLQREVDTPQEYERVRLQCRD